MPIGIIGAVVAGVGGALISGHAATSAANTEASAAAASNALQEKIYNSNVALAQPYITGGDTAENELQGFLGLGGDPAKINAAFQTYLNSTGYQFNRQQGIDAVTQNRAVSGLLNSGSALKALDTYGTNEADQYGQQYVTNLQGLTDTGQRAAGSLTGAGQSYANAVSSNNAGAANAAANAQIAGAAGATNALNNAVNAFGAFNGGSSFADGTGGGSTNAFAPSGSYDI